MLIINQNRLVLGDDKISFGSISWKKGSRQSNDCKENCIAHLVTNQLLHTLPGKQKEVRRNWRRGHVPLTYYVRLGMVIMRMTPKNAITGLQ